MTHDTADTALRFGWHLPAIGRYWTIRRRWWAVVGAAVIGSVMRPVIAVILGVRVGVSGVMRHPQLDGLDRLAALHGGLRLHPARQPALDERGQGGLGGFGAR